MLNWIFNSEKSKTDQLSKLSQNKILCVADDINSLFSDNKSIKLPELVVIGTQSSAKSSILNGIASMDILPTGEDMVTRIPLNVQLNKINNDMQPCVEFWNPNETIPKLLKKIKISTPILTKEETELIKNTIKTQTRIIAGSEKDISTNILNMRIYSSAVPNLSFTDLPGLVMMSRTDKGQSSDIKEKLEQMAISYLKRPKVIVLAVISSRTDLETDIGLALIKQHSSPNTKIIGVLTKPDLMNKDSHIGNYLCGKVSRAFKLDGGYFAVRCRSNTEKNEMTIQEGFKMEKNYFYSHPEYSKKIYSDRLTIGNLVNHITTVLVSSIRKDLPSVFNKLCELEKDTEMNLEKLGEKLPDTKDGKLAVLNKYISEFSQTMSKSITNDDSVFKTGVKLKNIFMEYRNKINKISPFISDKEKYNVNYFNTLVKSFEGNHMSSSVAPVKILEYYMQNKDSTPLKLLIPASINCVDNTIELMNELVSYILEDTYFSKYNQLSTMIKRLFQETFVQKLSIVTKNRINDKIEDERSYIWTDDPKFRQYLDAFSKSNNFMELIILFFETPKNTMKNDIPKMIMNNIVNMISNNLNSYLYDQIINKNKIELVEEDKSLADKRSYYTSIKKRINIVKKAMAT